MTKYVKIKADLNSQTFLYLLEKQTEKSYIIFQKSIYPGEKNRYLFFNNLQIAELQFNKLIN
ncbi:hypothetical protein [Defluviitalea raffinosedens]|uniref:hypothetical protein n=1 Tax=Defluviitalea raffinosedens TaxID=1450156 RepID=UPI001958337B|nr:hypothetical protein [Defluviitalea raffinosedens]MBM7684793.1 hypothetical protein [Defluviitalea raffinosedens]